MFAGKGNGSVRGNFMLDGRIVKGFGQLYQDYRDINIYAADTSCGYVTCGEMAISFFASCRVLTAFPKDTWLQGWPGWGHWDVPKPYG